MVSFDVSAVIRKDPQTVFEYYIDPANREAWSNHVLSGTWITDGPPGVGSVFQITTRNGGRRIRTERKITAYETHRKLCYEIDSGFIFVRSCQTFELDPDGTLFRIEGEMQPRGLLRLIFPLVARRQVAHLQEEANNLKQLLENN